jgi:hypothetical protein
MRFSNLVLAAVLAFPLVVASQSHASTVNLGTAGSFVVLAKTGISTTGSTLITGDIGVSPIAHIALTGFSETMDSTNAFSTSTRVIGRLYAADYAVPTPAKMTTAVSDMETAYTNAAGQAATVTELGAGNIGGMTITTGVYKWTTGLTIPTDVTLSGSASDVWVFQIAGDLSIASGGSVPAGIKVLLSGGALASNVFWQVGGSTGATLGTYSTFEGNILTAKQIILQTGAVLDGRALAQTQVTLDGNVVNAPVAPEPCTMLLLGAGVAGLLAAKKRRMSVA